MRLLATTVRRHLALLTKTTATVPSVGRRSPSVVAAATATTPPSSSRPMCSVPPVAAERQLRIGPSDVHYVEAGAGDRALLLLPGALGTAWTDFRPQLEQLPALLPQHRLIAWDPPGYGKSRPPDKQFTVDFYERDADTARQLMERLGIERYGVLGWSDGGITGLILAADHPARVEQLVVWGANAYISPAEVKIYEGIRDVSKWSTRMREPMERVYGVEQFPVLWSAWVDGLLELYRARQGDICRAKLKNIRARTLVVHGALDPMIIPDHVPYLLNSIKDSDLHVFPEGKHNIHLRYADEFNRLVSEFVLKQ